jgi:predicted DsbA family dithiol-disulfide isomerase
MTEAAIILSENFDGVVAPALPSGWTTTGSPPTATLWTTSTTAPNSPPNAAFVPDPAAITDVRLLSPIISLIGATDAVLTFSNFFDLENGFDGGVLEISINGGAFTDIVASGGSFVAGGYTGTLSVNFGNPLGGRQAWTGNSGGYITTTIDLPEGREMAGFYAERKLDPEAMYRRMKGLMDQEGLPYGRRTHTYNSRMAQELGKWADTMPGGGALHDVLYRAYFVDARNIGDPEILVEIAQAVGLPADEARAVLAERRFKDAVDADWARSRRYGITGVPPFVAGGYGVVGAQPYEVLVQLVEKAGARRRG